ncbi:putative uncharacterized protein [Waddlia chondrophila 2032/99]|nr:putative uncharacterized protein [Waddlia chondrophila 2032/99]
MIGVLSLGKCEGYSPKENLSFFAERPLPLGRGCKAKNQG